MEEKKSTIKFRGKELSLLVAKCYAYRLQIGTAKLDLTETEKLEYHEDYKSIIKSNKKAIAQNGQAIFKELNEDEYFIAKLKSAIAIKEHFNKMEYCEKNGHVKGNPHMTSGHSGTKVWDTCPNCGTMYSRRPNSDEWAGWNRMMNGPMTL